MTLPGLLMSSPITPVFLWGNFEIPRYRITASSLELVEAQELSLPRSLIQLQQMWSTLNRFHGLDKAAFCLRQDNMKK